MNDDIVCTQEINVNLNDWLMASVNLKNGRQDTTRKHLVCNDGTTMSVQASEYHYCSPRRSYIDCNTEEITYFEYSTVEVWCVSCDVPDSWLEYGNQEDDPYAYIPINMVEEFIKMHGGIKE